MENPNKNIDLRKAGISYCDHGWNNVGICSTCGMKKEDYIRDKIQHPPKVIVKTYKGCIEKVIVHGVNMPFEIEEIRSDAEEKNERN